MRVLIAIDGSPGAHAAAELARAMAWPAQTTVRLLSVMDPGAWIPPGPGVPGRGGLKDERDVRAYLEGQQLLIVDEFAGTTTRLEADIVRGRPGDAILDEATRFGADAVVAGSRGHGKLAALLLGSVSAELVDRAPCPALIARGTSLNRVVLAIDGSSSSRAAVRLTASWPAFEGVPIAVTAVTEVMRPWEALTASATGSGEADDGGARHTASAEARSLAAETVDELRRAGRSAEPEVRRGQAAAQIIAAARKRRADMIVIGCRGRSAASRIRLGSVARDVLLASRASILAVRHSD